MAISIVRLALAEFSFKQVKIGGLPLHGQDDDASPAGPVKRLKSEIRPAYLDASSTLGQPECFIQASDDGNPCHLWHRNRRGFNLAQQPATRFRRARS